MNHITLEGIELIKHFEGLRLEAYQCSANEWTIGYGTRYTALGPVRKGQRITMSEAESMLASDVRLFERRVSDQVTVPLNDQQFSALVAFSYNVGSNAMAESTLLRKLNKSDYEGAADELLKWNKVRSNGVFVPQEGLTRRRKAERAMFLGNDWRAHT